MGIDELAKAIEKVQRPSEVVDFPFEGKK